MMAHCMQTGDFLQELNCPVCLELFKDPVILECGHSFCKTCIDKTWNSAKNISCPECREEFSSRKYTVSIHLSNQSERARLIQQEQKEEITEPEQRSKSQDSDLKKRRANQHCVEHKKQLELFCEEDQIVVCPLCVPNHYGHHFKSLEEAVNMYHAKLKVASVSLESSLKDLQELQKEQEQKVSSIKEQALSLEQHIRSEFNKLHMFLQDKEHQLIQQLKGEEAGILTELEINVKKIEEKSAIVHQEISDIQLKMQEKDLVLCLIGIKEEIKRFTKPQEEEILPEVTVVAGDLSLGVYKGPLQYRVWKEMRSIINPVPSLVLLDPNTAHPNLILSEDHTSVRWDSTEQQLPKNAERFDKVYLVLGSNGFTSGRHCWEVEVGNKSSWIVGVAKQSCTRKGNFKINSENGYLFLEQTNKLLTIQGKQVKQTNIYGKSKKILVYLNYEAGQVSFYSCDDMSHIITFSDTFSEKLYPVFNPYSKNTEPLTMVHHNL
ncbi:zinc-binding protein A33-like [Protopterus annectens]|uniref:zinc-binding protein A33-like n=1 Tax=Protopterus annectens TaxID=7888 RepID=UPI001CF9CD2A|nr:zinc-binding protein A33-like [Protopterus annectens]